MMNAHMWRVEMRNQKSIAPSRGVATGGLVLWAILGAAPPAAADAERWYTREQVRHGAGVFAQHCAQCHGANAEATPGWRKPNAEGNYPPPPLDGTAHAWHHPLDMLRRTIRTGGAPTGGLMPPFEDKLSAQDIDAAIAFFQAEWPEEIYTVWQLRNGKASPFVRTVAPAEAPNPVTAQLKKRLSQSEIGEPQPTPLSGSKTDSNR